MAAPWIEQLLEVLKRPDKGVVLFLPETNVDPANPQVGFLKVFARGKDIFSLDSDGTKTSLEAGGGGGGPPGTWTQLGKGPTTIADDTEVTVLANQTMAAGEIPVMHAIMRATPSSDNPALLGDTTTGPGNTELQYAPVKDTAGTIDFRLRHEDGGSRQIDWVAQKVLPA